MDSRYPKEAASTNPRARALLPRSAIIGGNRYESIPMQFIGFSLRAIEPERRICLQIDEFGQ
jgi:hypothetical protein